ncbi:hypothetical protein CVT26_015084 [Gymnopilus dilepis]|uniref:Amidohydrolase-related domain-containing protein n=1 Tax=Gymnopilus dilepis TaxID=231916 RepID=A0A409YEN2_9AGAR|nr:hypothetical protein CVT26_015084 [Gymnopilus dilepis]
MEGSEKTANYVQHVPALSGGRTRTPKALRRLLGVLLCACIAQSIYVFSHGLFYPEEPLTPSVQARRAALLEKCQEIRTPAGPPPSYRTVDRVKEGSDRWLAGTPPTLIRNAKIWTGARNGTEVVFGDVLLDKGVVAAVGYIPEELLETTKSAYMHTFGRDLDIVDADGRWITPGLVDLHSHIGVNSAPHLSGAMDGNSHKAPILPWLRSIDGLNTHDDSYQIATAGGVTTAQILPGSANNIGGQAFVIKLRSTAERSATSKVIEPPQTLTHSENGTEYPRWRHMKHACGASCLSKFGFLLKLTLSTGENPDRLYKQTRMDAQWNFRNAYNEARKIREKQDAFCAKADAGDWASLEAERTEFPEDLQWESLVDVLRGKVKLSIHCYEAVDLEGIVRLSNEFKFPVASFHHAGETYLVPDLLKKTYGGAPSIALFATNFRKKREAYRGSEFAPRVLAEHNIPVVMKVSRSSSQPAVESAQAYARIQSDHPVVNSRYLIYEAQLAHYYGLPTSLALESVTTTPARAAGLSHRVGSITEGPPLLHVLRRIYSLFLLGYDADLVIWDSHPLSLGATPTQVWVDGIKQLANPYPLSKPGSFQDVPKVPNWDKEKEDTVKWEGLPPLKGWQLSLPQGSKRRVMIKNVRSMWVYEGEGDEEIVTLFDDDVSETDEIAGEAVDAEAKKVGRTVVIEDGNIIGAFPGSSDSASFLDDMEVIDLQGGSIAPGLTSYGSPLGLVEIRLEPSTNDGNVIDPLVDDEVPPLLEGEFEDDFGIVRALDGLAFEGRNPLLAYRAGVTTAVTAPTGTGFLRGLGVAFSVGAPHALAKGAIVQKETALHVALSLGFPVSVSEQVAALRRQLFGYDDDDDEEANRQEDEALSVWERVRRGKLPLVVTVDSADIMTTLLALKSEYEDETGKTLKLTFSGATEAHLLANEIAKADVNVVLTSPRPFPNSWEQRRILPGPPLSKESSITALLNAGVNVAVGVTDEASARNARFDLAWIALEANGTLSKSETLALATINLHKAIGLTTSSSRFGHVGDLVMYSGGSVLDFESKPVGVISASRRRVELF